MKYKLSKKYKHYIKNIKRMNKKQIHSNLVNNKIIKQNSKAPSNIFEHLLIFSHNMNIKKK